MLVRITREQATLGMFIHALEGSWIDHPFWRKKFLLTNPRDLAKLHASVIDAVIIDDERGLGVDRADPEAARPIAEAIAPAAAPVAIPARIRPRRIDRTPCDADQEADRAQRIVSQARAAMRGLIEDVRAGKAVAPERLSPLVDGIAASVARNASALINILRIKTKDEYTYLHSVAVSALMINLAITLEIDEARIADIGMAGLLHDAGKILVPAAVLNKAGDLSAEEFAQIKAHPVLGGNLLRRSRGVPETAIDVCLHHHERMDGQGYPYGLPPAAVSLAARMAAVCDVYDALTSDRVYKTAWTPQQAVSAMLRWEGQFDPRILDAFVRSIGIYPIGALVRVRSDYLAIVVGENPADPMRPIIRAFYSITAGCRLTPEDIAVATSATLLAEKPENWGFEDWQALAADLLSPAGAI